MRIVVIDDESQTRASVIRLLGRLGEEYTVIGEAGNGYEGMLLIKDLRPDLVITDIMMPRISGLDMIESAHCCAPETYFIILSGYAEFEFAQRAINLPVVQYLLKPITVEQMQEALNRVSENIASLTSNPKSQPENQPNIQNNYSDITTYIVNEIHKSYTQRLYLDAIAGQLKVTPEYAGNVFSRETGKSFSVYLRDVRIDKAKELLENTDLKMYEIAFKVGYSDEKYFCRVFKECTGSTPKRYSRGKLKDR